jgi:hypothetical protein
LSFPLLSPPTFPVVVETINPTAFSPLSCGSSAYHPRLGHRARSWTISSLTSLVVDIKESTTHAAFFVVVFPYRLTLHLPLACSLPPTFWSSARHLCVSVSLLPPTTHPNPPPPISPHPQLFTRARHEPSHCKLCQTPNLPSPFHPPSLTTHAPTWCPGS